MPLFIYTATRNLKTGHVVDTDYLIQIGLQKADDEQPKAITSELRSLNGNIVTTFHRIETYIDFLTDYIGISAARPAPGDFAEFFHSVAGGENFTYNENEGFNLLTDSKDFSGGAWTLGGTPVVVTNVAAAPDGTTTADSIEDNSAAAIESLTQAMSGFNPALQQFARVYIKKDSTPRTTRAPYFAITYDGSTTENNSIFVDTQTGDHSLSLFDGNIGGVIDHGGDYWEAWLLCSTVDTANTTCQAFIAPAAASGAAFTPSVTVTGTITAWNLELYQPAELSKTLKMAGDPTRTREGLHYSYNFRAEVL